MKKIILILSLLAFIASGCGRATKQQAETVSDEQSQSQRQIRHYFNNSGTIVVCFEDGAARTIQDYWNNSDNFDPNTIETDETCQEFTNYLLIGGKKWNFYDNSGNILEGWRIIKGQKVEGQAKDPVSSTTLEGRYRYSDENGCELLLDILKTQTGYSYKFQVNNKLYEGNARVSQEGDKINITLEGIPWKKDLGALKKGDNPDEMENRYESSDIYLWCNDEGQFTFQNYGNSQNYYEVLDCGDKYVSFVKE